MGEKNYKKRWDGQGKFKSQPSLGRKGHAHNQPLVAAKMRAWSCSRPLYTCIMFLNQPWEVDCKSIPPFYNYTWGRWSNALCFGCSERIERGGIGDFSPQLLFPSILHFFIPPYLFHHFLVICGSWGSFSCDHYR